MTAATGLLYALFAGIVLAWPSDRARLLSDFSHGSLVSAAAALSGWVLSSLALAALPLLAAFGLMTLSPGLVMLWRWAGLATVFWLATAGQLAPSLAYRPLAANDNMAVTGVWRVVARSFVKGYSWQMAVLVAAIMPQFIESTAPAAPQILFAAAVFAALTLLSAAFYGLFPARSHAFLNLIPERRKALKTALTGQHQHGQTRISYRRKAA